MIDNVNVKRIVLEKVKLGLAQKFPQVCRDLDLDIISKRYIFELSTFILKSGEETSIKDINIDIFEPKSWWQMFRRDVLKHKNYKIKLKEIKRYRIKATDFLTFPENSICMLPDVRLIELELGRPVHHLFTKVEEQPT